MKLEKSFEVQGFFSVFSENLDKVVKDIPGVLDISKNCEMNLRLFLNQNFQEFLDFRFSENIACILGKTEGHECVSLFGIRPKTIPMSLIWNNVFIDQKESGYVQDCITIDLQVKFAIIGDDLFRKKEELFFEFSFGFDFLSSFLYGGDLQENGKHSDQKRWDLVTQKETFGSWQSNDFIIKRWDNARVSLGITNTTDFGQKSFSRATTQKTIFSFHFCSINTKKAQGLNDVFERIDILQKFFGILFDRPISITNVRGKRDVKIKKFTSKKVEKTLSSFGLFCSENSDRRIRPERVMGHGEISSSFEDVKNYLETGLENFIENYESHDGFRAVSETYLESVFDQRNGRIERLANLCIFLAKDLDSYKYSELKGCIDCLMKSLPKEGKFKDYIEKFNVPEKIKDLRNFGAHLENLLKNTGIERKEKTEYFAYYSEMVLKILIKFCILRYLFPKNKKIKTNLIERTERFLLPDGFDPGSGPFFTAKSKYGDFDDTPVFLEDVESELNKLKNEKYIRKRQ